MDVSLICSSLAQIVHSLRKTIAKPPIGAHHISVQIRRYFGLHKLTENETYASEFATSLTVLLPMLFYGFVQEFLSGRWSNTKKILAYHKLYV